MLRGPARWGQVESRIGPGSWVMFIDRDGQVVEGRAISDAERLGAGQAVIWVDVAQPEGTTLATPVPANELRLVERL